ncbi:hypothetical protein J2W46_002129 [Paraburkholderia strydomiana]|nr:hypothetical protein [Paraburkholderia strydomiana]
MPHSIASGFFAGVGRAATERGRADYYPCSGGPALRARHRFVTLRNAAHRFESAAFDALIVINWHGVWLC